MRDVESTSVIRGSSFTDADRENHIRDTKG